ncbi:unnamed protein product [Phyllotreta striolata]|uniref:Uncharacterized protein n=1 Tax=Phyllotreta striolata TaxID=444603 RepID=A0A9N9XRS0_PHYSR|nr:unnamed protein product [Phyllotreta striolata]
MLDTRKDEKNGLQKRLKKVYDSANELDESLFKSDQLDRHILMMMKIDRLRDQSICSQLQEAQKENKQLLNMLQLDDGRNIRGTNSNTSCSTMSLVHLQYKYEELVANQNGLLKILDMRHQELKKYHEENVNLKEAVENLKYTIKKYEIEFTKLLEEIRKIKNRKNRKIHKLKTERDTLKMVHNKFVGLLNKQTMEQDQALMEQLRLAENSEKALLIQEIRKNNGLLYENFQLHQKIDYLEAKLNTKSKTRRSHTASSSSSRCVH